MGNVILIDTPFFERINLTVAIYGYNINDIFVLNHKLMSNYGGLCDLHM